jgi:hypothetical protein
VHPPDKQLHSLAELTHLWRRCATTLLGEDATGWTRRVLDRHEAVVLRADDISLDMIDNLGQSVVAVVGEEGSTWRRWNLHAEASRQTMGWRFATTPDRETIVAMIVDSAQSASLRLTPEELSVPAEFQRPDGSSMFRTKLYSVKSVLPVSYWVSCQCRLASFAGLVPVGLNNKTEAPFCPRWIVSVGCGERSRMGISKIAGLA